MALTRNLKRTGRAGAYEKAELRMELYQQQQNLIETMKLDWGDAMEELRRRDPTGWSQWYDDNVPDWNGWWNIKPALDVIRNRVNELKSV